MTGQIFCLAWSGFRDSPIITCPLYPALRNLSHGELFIF
ncbi:MAG: hypothetical protein OP8BY_2223 [Candidatus Saccharicenans subterraneus]|uniref:Uncharacterized protein n=1 Tax=Candidatus Saccharicenans subterraneus TaxID=2508984 RepID=A0A3E2BM48_9BACT|nr:MAG: hypothetical protein OP8BY_2223 [Candidatus Saccharicenans subterraneum]